MSRTTSLLATTVLSLLLTGLGTTAAVADGTTGIGWDAAPTAPTATAGDTGIGWDAAPTATTSVEPARRGL